MVNRKKVVSQVGSALAPKLVELAPGITSAVVQNALHQAIRGVKPLPPAAVTAQKRLDETNSDVDKAIREVIQHHVGLAAAEGAATNFGGIVTFAATLPAAVAGLALIQCRMVAIIAHLRGYDLDDQRTRNAILVCLLGEDRVNRQVVKKKLPAPPMAIATAPAVDPQLDDRVAAEIASEMLSRVAGKRLATTVARRTPVMGGVVGGTTDGWSTWRVGRYAARELRPRNLR